MAPAGAPSWRRFITFPLAGRTALLGAALLAAPFCAVGIVLDDYHQQLVVERNSPLALHPSDVFVMAPRDPVAVQHNIETGPYLWWMPPTACWVFVRPLSAALTNFDHWLFGRQFWLQHLHSIAWYLALVAVVIALLKKALGPESRVAALGAVLFAVHGAHPIAVGWLSNRNALVAALPALLGLLAHLRWRETKQLAFLPLSLGGYALGLAGGESAASALAYLAAYELTVAPGSRRTRLLALVPAGLLGLGYALLYRAQGAGTNDSGVYVDPLSAPARFLAEAPMKAFTLAGGLFVQGAPEAWMLGPTLRPVLALLGVASLALVALVLTRLWPRLDAKEQGGLRWLSLGAALSLLPLLATFPMSRLLLAASVGGSAVVAAVLLLAWSASDRLSRAAARGLLVSTVALGAVGWPAAAVALKAGGDFQTQTALSGTLSDEALSGRVMVLVAPDASVAMYAEMVRRWNQKPAAQSWVTLSFAPYAHRLTRVSDDTIDLEVVGGHWLETHMEQLFRSPSNPLPLGAQVRLSGATLTVAGVEHGLPKRVRVQFDQNPEQSGYTLLRFEGPVLTAVELPAVGKTLELPRVDSPLSMRPL